MNQLTISDYGTSLGKRSERVSVRYRGEERAERRNTPSWIWIRLSSLRAGLACRRT